MSHEISSKLASGLAKIGLVIRHQAWKAAGESGLAPSQSQTLALIDARGGGVGMTMSAVAAELAVTPATASEAVAALERRGFLARSRDARDARIIRVSLTDQGFHLARRSAVWPDMLLRAIQELNDTEQVVFLRGLIKMLYSLQESGEIPMARMCPTCVYFRADAHPREAKSHHCQYVDAPIGGADLRIDCAEHRVVSTSEMPRLWQLFVNGVPPAAMARAGGSAATSAGRGRNKKENNV